MKIKKVCILTKEEKKALTDTLEWFDLYGGDLLDEDIISEDDDFYEIIYKVLNYYSPED